MDKTYQTLVIGAGINGLATSYHLSKLGVKNIGLIERFDHGHNRGSSHGQSRITRSAYINEHYVRLMQIAHQEAWPQLEKDANTQLIYPTSGCFFGPPGGKYTSYEKAVTSVGVDVEPLTPQEARKRFPAFRFEGAAGALHDRTAGLVAASKTIQSLAQIIEQSHIDIHTHTEVLEIDPAQTPIKITTNKDTFFAEHLIVTAGPWVANLIPQIKTRVSVARQTVAYFKLSGPPEQYQVGTFPVWGYLLNKGDVGYYGLPEFGREGIKLAHHVITPEGDDPDDIPTETPEDAIEGLRQFIKEQFTAPIERFVDWETCLYTNTSNEDFIIDHHPDNPNIVIGAGFSGHGFKFGPLTGRILAELSLNGKSSLPEFENAKHLFSFQKP
jgi:monomeric sarcosine oxidase